MASAASSVAICSGTTTAAASFASAKAATKTALGKTAFFTPKTHRIPTRIAAVRSFSNYSSSSLPFSACRRRQMPPSPPKHDRAAAAATATAGVSDPPSVPTTPSALGAQLKSRLAAGDVLYGLFLLSANPTLAEIAGHAGYDYVVVDMEHGYGGISEALACLRALAGTGTPAILRLPESSATWAKKALDLGPQGVMFPMIETPEAAAEAVSFCRFPPKGVRGSAHPVVRASAYGVDEGYLENYEDALLVMVQVETATAVANLEGVAAVEGVDAVQMGPLDLSASLGYLWEPGHRKVRQVLADVEKRMLEGGGKGKAYLGGFAMPHDSPTELKKRGYHMVAGAVDLGMFRQAAVEDVSRFRTAPGTGGDKSGHQDGEEEDKDYWSE